MEALRIFFLAGGTGVPPLRFSNRHFFQQNLKRLVFKTFFVHVFCHNKTWSIYF
jgi:hypothetical protein